MDHRRNRYQHNVSQNINEGQRPMGPGNPSFRTGSPRPITNYPNQNQTLRNMGPVLPNVVNKLAAPRNPFPQNSAGQFFPPDNIQRPHQTAQNPKTDTGPQNRYRLPFQTSESFPGSGREFRQGPGIDGISCVTVNTSLPVVPPVISHIENATARFQPPLHSGNSIINEGQKQEYLQNVPTFQGNIYRSPSSSLIPGSSGLPPRPISGSIQNNFQPFTHNDGIVGEPKNLQPNSESLLREQHGIFNYHIDERNIPYSNFPQPQEMSVSQNQELAMVPNPINSLPVSFTQSQEVPLSHMQSSQLQNKDETKNIRERDKVWVKKWLFNKKGGHTMKFNNKKIKIHTVQASISDVMTCLAKLNNQRSLLTEFLKNDTDEKWKTEKGKLSHLEAEFEKKIEMFEDNEVMEEIRKKLDRRKKKRERERRKKLEKSELQKAALHRREELHKSIDAWQNQLIQENSDRKQEKELKKQADNIMSEVRKKLNETEKTLEMLKSLEKLRNIRKDAAQKRGLYATLESDSIFSEKIEKAKQILLNQKKTYDAEAMTLQVMLETEQEETREKEKEKERQKSLEIEERQQRKLQRILFGKEEIVYPDNPLYPFHKFYNQAHESFESLLKIRQDWDTFIVPENTPGASKIPIGFVVPVKPSSKIWKTALKKQ